MFRNCDLFGALDYIKKIVTTYTSFDDFDSKYITRDGVISVYESFVEEIIQYLRENVFPESK